MTDAMGRDVLKAMDPECTVIRELMLAEADRDLTVAESDRIETHVCACDACLALLAGDDERLSLPGAATHPLAWTPPLPAEWRRVSGVHRDPTAESPLLRPRESRRSLGSTWRILVPLAAIALGAILLQQFAHELVEPGLPTPGEESVVGVELAIEDEPEFVELIDIPDDASVEIMFPEDENGAVIIFVNEF